MPSEFLRIIGYIKGESSHSITILSQLISESDGWILDFNLFSNISICLRFEISAKYLNKLRLSLSYSNVQLSDESSALLNGFCNQIDHGELSAEFVVAGTINVTFIHDEPDLRIDVPAIPG